MPHGTEEYQPVEALNPNRNRDRYRNRDTMTLGHEKLDVYRLSIGYVAWVYETVF